MIVGLNVKIHIICVKLTLSTLGQMSHCDVVSPTNYFLNIEWTQSYAYTGCTCLSTFGVSEFFISIGSHIACKNGVFVIETHELGIIFIVPPIIDNFTPEMSLIDSSIICPKSMTRGLKSTFESS